MAPVLRTVTTPAPAVGQTPDPTKDTTAISVIPSWLKSPIEGAGKNWSQQPLPAFSCHILENSAVPADSQELLIGVASEGKERVGIVRKSIQYGHNLREAITINITDSDSVVTKAFANWR